MKSWIAGALITCLTVVVVVGAATRHVSHKQYAPQSRIPALRDQRRVLRRRGWKTRQSRSLAPIGGFGRHAMALSID